MCIRDRVREALARGQDVLIKLDVQGAATVKELIPDALMIFLAPPSLEELERRLRFRQSESVKALHLRLEAAKDEMQSIGLFDYKVVNQNHRLDLAAFCIDSIITSEKCRFPPRRLEEF